MILVAVPGIHYQIPRERRNSNRRAEITPPKSGVVKDLALYELIVMTCPCTSLLLDGRFHFRVPARTRPTSKSSEALGYWKRARMPGSYLIGLSSPCDIYI